MLIDLQAERRCPQTVLGNDRSQREWDALRGIAMPLFQAQAAAGVRPTWWPHGVPFRTIGDMSGNNDLQTVIRAVAFKTIGDMSGNNDIQTVIRAVATQHVDQTYDWHHPFFPASRDAS